MNTRTAFRLVLLAVSAAIAAAACAADPTASRPPSPSVAPSVAPSPTNSTSPDPTIAPYEWPYESNREFRDVIFAPDGRTVIVETDFEARESVVVVLDPDGLVADGWPWAHPPNRGPRRSGSTWT